MQDVNLEVYDLEVRWKRRKFLTMAKRLVIRQIPVSIEAQRVLQILAANFPTDIQAGDDLYLQFNLISETPLLAKFERLPDSVKQRS